MEKSKDEEWEKLYALAKRMLDENMKFEEIENHLKLKTNNEEIINEIIRQLKRIRHAIKTKNGLSKLGIGALFLIGGFLITCINFHANQSFTLVMYGFTSFGLALMFWGLVDIIG